MRQKEAREQAKQRGTRRARGKHSSAYHSMSRGGCQGEYTPGGYLGAGEDRVERVVRGTAGHAWGNEHK